VLYRENFSQQKQKIFSLPGHNLMQKINHQLSRIPQNIMDLMKQSSSGKPSAAFCVLTQVNLA